jgi:transposase
MTRVGPGRPRERPHHLIADKAFSHPSTRRALRRRGIAYWTPGERDTPGERHQRAHRRARGSAGGRPPALDRDRYEQRSVVGRCFNRLKQFRALATRFAERAAYFRATLLLVSTVLQLHARSAGQALDDAVLIRRAVDTPDDDDVGVRCSLASACATTTWRSRTATPRAGRESECRGTR